MLIKIQHAGYMVPNLDEAVEWYVNTLGGVYWKGGETETSKIRLCEAWRRRGGADRTR